jgi:hypothetical protein
MGAKAPIEVPPGKAILAAGLPALALPVLDLGFTVWSPRSR